MTADLFDDIKFPVANMQFMLDIFAAPRMPFGSHHFNRPGDAFQKNFAVLFCKSINDKKESQPGKECQVDKYQN